MSTCIFWAPEMQRRNATRWFNSRKLGFVSNQTHWFFIINPKVLFRLRMTVNLLLSMHRKTLLISISRNCGSPLQWPFLVHTLNPTSSSLFKSSHQEPCLLCPICNDSERASLTYEYVAHVELELDFGDAPVAMAEGYNFPGIAFIAIIDGLVAFFLFIILFNISTSCWPLKYWWLTILEVAFIFVSVIGMLAAFVGSHQILLSYFFLELVLTVVLTIYVIDSWKVGAGNWAQLKNCLRTAEFCQDQMSANLFNPIFIACCKEPAFCNQSSKNSSFYNQSCHLWSTDSKILCYDCRSCMDAVLSDFRLSGKLLAILSTTFLGLFLSLYITQVFLYWKAKEQQLQRAAAGQPQPTWRFGGARSSTRVAPSPNLT